MNGVAFTELFQVTEVVFTGEKHYMCTNVFSVDFTLQITQ